VERRGLPSGLPALTSATLRGANTWILSTLRQWLNVRMFSMHTSLVMVSLYDLPVERTVAISIVRQLDHFQHWGSADFHDPVAQCDTAGQPRQ